MVAPDNLMESPMDRNASKEKSPLTNGNDSQPTSTTSDREVNEEVPKQPSYVALACCISGYTTLSYDSKQRSGLRSRPASPIRVEGNQNATFTSECGNYLTPLPRDINASKMQTQGKGIDILNGCGGLHSPRRVANMTLTQDSRNYKSSIVSESYSSLTSTTNRYSYSNSSYSTTNSSYSTTTSEKTNGSRLITPTNITEQMPPSSFIMQRVERLYGPGALAQGFYTGRKSNTNKESTKTTASPSTPSDKTDKNDDSLPVLKLLRPEFRAQLTVANRKVKATPDQLSSLDESSPMDKKGISTDVVDATAFDRKPQIIEGEVKDGHYYLKLLAEQVHILEEQAAKTEKELETCDNEDASGVLRAAAGKARLLVAQKLNQFRGLCHKNIEQSSGEDFPTTNEDLAGFWDMVMIQVNDILTQFDRIAEMKKNNWKITDQKKNESNWSTARVNSTVKKNPVKKIPEAKDPAVAKARDEARKKLIEDRRKALKESKQNANSDVLLL